MTCDMYEHSINVNLTKQFNKNDQIEPFKRIR